MGHTYTSLLYHVVFSTKRRRRMLDHDMMPRMKQYVGGLLRKRKGKLLALNGPQDHVHLVALFPASVAMADMVRDLKCYASAWVHDNLPGQRFFAWQEGYSAFTVGKSTLDRVLRYVANQQVHHRRRTFQDELIDLLERAGIEYDRRYVFR